MTGLKQSKRVSWAPDVNLCQVRLFISEDAPSQSGLGAQDNLQAKASWLWHATGMGSDDSLPPGFEAPQTLYQFKKEISQIPLIKWQCPPRFLLNTEWQVVAGEESEEVVIQNQRQLGVLEAIYPRPFSIPPNPSVSSEVQGSHHTDLDTPLIPITAIEDEDTSEPSAMEPPLDIPVQLQKPDSPKSFLPDFRCSLEQSQSNAVPPVNNLPCREKLALGLEPGAEPDVVAAATAAFTAIMRSNEEGSLIDHDLLIKILTNPSLMEKLLADYGTPKQMSVPVAPVSAPPPPPLINLSVPLSAPPTTHFYPIPNVAPTPALNPQPLPATVQINTKPPVKAPPVKDRNYYKSLIQQHGGEKQEVPEPDPMQFGNRHDYHNNFTGMKSMEPIIHGSEQRDLRPKIPKPCVYFNSPRGCRHGANCSYQHEGSFSAKIEPKSSKRIKLDREIARRN